MKSDKKAASTNDGNPALDIRWLSALEEFELPKKADPKRLAKLLRSGVGAPADVLELLAELIDPKLDIFDYKLVPKCTKARSKRVERGHKRLKLAMEMGKELREGRTVEVAAENVAEREAVTARWVIKCWAPFGRRFPRLMGRQKDDS